MDAPSPQQQLGRLITGYWMSQAVYVAAKLEIADKLVAGPQTVEQLAAATGAHAPSLFRLLRALATVGIFREIEGQKFQSTPMADLLRRDVPGSQWALAAMMGGEQYVAWGQLLHSVRTGEGGFRKQYGEPVFEYLAHHSEAAQIFDAGMTSIHGRETAPMLDAYDFGQFGHLVDVGGGNGSLLEQLLDRYPTTHGTVFDLPHVIERAQTRLADAAVKSRLSFQAGDFFKSISPSADAYLLRHIIHDWNDEQSVTILRNCVAALKPGGKVLLVECVIPPGNDFMFGKWLDLTMLVIPEGKERTADEYRALYSAAGLKLVEVVPTATEMSIIVGEKA